MGEERRVFSDLEQAIAFCESALQKDPKNVAVRASLGDCYVRKDWLEEAEAELTDVWEIIGKPVYSYIPLVKHGWKIKEIEASKLEGKIHTARGELDLAEVCFKSVLSYIPGELDAHALLGAVYLKKGEHEKAINLLKYATKKESRADLEFNLGKGYYSKVNYEEAQKHFRKAIELNAQSRWIDEDTLMLAQIYAGISLSRLSRHEEAKPFLEIASESNLDLLEGMFPQVIFNLGFVRLFSDKDFVAAQKLFKRAFTLFPEDDENRDQAKGYAGFAHVLQLLTAEYSEGVRYAASRHRVFRVDSSELAIKMFNDSESLTADLRVTSFFSDRAEQYTLNIPKTYKVMNNPKQDLFVHIMQQIVGPELHELAMSGDPGFLDALREVNIQMARMHELSLSDEKELQMEDILRKDPDYFVNRFFNRFLAFYGIALDEIGQDIATVGLRVLSAPLQRATEKAYYGDFNPRNWRQADKMYTLDHESSIIGRRFFRKTVHTLKLPSVIDLINLLEFGSAYLSDEQEEQFMKQYIDEREEVGQRQINRSEFRELYPNAGFFRHHELFAYRKRDEATETDQWIPEAQQFHLAKGRENLSIIIPETKLPDKDALLRFEELLVEKIN